MCIYRYYITNIRLSNYYIHGEESFVPKIKSVTVSLFHFFTLDLKLYHIAPNFKENNFNVQLLKLKLIFIKFF